MEPATAPQPRALDASRGGAWIAQGFELFKKAPGPWIATFLVWFVLYAVVSVIPGGGLLATLFGEVLIAGWMLGCRSLDTGGELKVEHLFAAFKSDQLSQLVIVGAIYLGGMFLVFLIAGVLAGGSLLPLIWGSSSANLAQFGLSLLLAILLVMALMVPLLMATWFAPALVIFDRQPPVEAMKQSFAACMHNVVPFLLYGVIGLCLAMLAAIPLGLGFIVLGPVLIASIYTSYRDVFLGDRAPAGG
ncbi:MAG TPA: BPSS1780 family membrane protein [Nevskiaceae bacterium]|nr:BPSS1780 family membrane protein [Nevskiaceae bacterium]